MTGGVVSLHRPAGASTELLGMIAELEELARTQLALLGTGDYDVPDLQRILSRLDAGEIGDFTAAAARAYQRARRRADNESQRMDFVETQIHRALVSVGRQLAEKLNEMRSVIGEIDRYLRQRAVADWRSQEFAVWREFNAFVQGLNRIVAATAAWMTRVAQAVEEWIDMVRTLGPTPSPDQQLTARAERIQSLMTGLPVDPDGTIRGGLPTLVEHILRRGDLMVGEDHNDSSMMLWLARHMDEMHRNGVRVLMIEMNRRLSQRILNDFMATGNTAALREALRPVAALWGESRAAADLTLLQAARRNNIRIVAMDTSMADLTGWGDGGGRVVVSNPFWAGVYRQERDALPPDQRILIVGGSLHSRTVSGFESYFPNVYSIDGYDSAVHSRIGVSVSPGQAIVHPSQPFPSPTTADEPFGTFLSRDNSDFIARPTM